MPFTVESVPSLPEIQPCAGSAHFHDGDLYLGAYDGAAHAIRGERWDYVARAKVGAVACLGVRSADDCLIALAQDVAISKVGDWGVSLVTLDHTLALKTRCPLGRGNWRLASGRHEHVAVVYDTSEDQGLAAVDFRAGEVLWRRALGSVIAARIEGPESMVALTCEPALVVFSLPDGDVREHFSLPLNSLEPRCIARLGTSGWAVGGRSARKDGAALSLLRNQEAPLLHVWKPEAVFDENTIAYARDDEASCGFALDEVAAVVSLDDAGRRLAVAIGGDLACQSACAVGLLDTTTGAWLGPQVIDTENGASRFDRATDGTLLLDCAGSFYLLRVDAGV